MRYVINGGGIAGTTAAEELRKLDADAEIVLVSEEFHPLYSRVLLTPFLIGKVPRERVFIKKEGWYSEKNIEWLTGVSATALDAVNQFVVLSDGRELPFDKLLIATGGDSRVLSDDVRGVSYLRTLDDADHLAQLIQEQGSNAVGVIFGGGFIACEYLNIFGHFSINTTIAFRGPYFWSKVLQPELGNFINIYLTNQGVQVVPEAAFVKALGEKECTGLETSKGIFSCTILGVGIGLELEDAWMKNAGLRVNAGIDCDEYLQTNLSNVFVAGDVAHVFDVNIEKHVTVGNWMNAQMQGRVAAKNMAGEKTVFSLVSSYAINVLGMEVIFIGNVAREHADEVFVVGVGQKDGVGQIHTNQGRIIGAVLLNRNTDRPKITKMIQEKALLDLNEFC